MKKILLILSTMMLSISIIFAQAPKEKKTPEQRAEMRAKHLTNKLGLSADQSSEIKAALLTRMTKADAIRAKYSNATDKKAMKSEMKPVHEEFVNKINSILTPDQKSKLEQIKAEHKEKRQAKKQNMNSNPQVDPISGDQLD